MEDKFYYTISEVADMLGLSQSLIRYWETEFPQQINPKRNKRGVRFYTPKDIEKIRLINHLVKEEHYTLKGAKEAMKKKRTQAAPQNDTTENTPQDTFTTSPVTEDAIITTQNDQNRESDISMHNEKSLQYNHRKIYEKLKEIKCIAQEILARQNESI